MHGGGEPAKTIMRDGDARRDLAGLRGLGDRITPLSILRTSVQRIVTALVDAPSTPRPRGLSRLPRTETSRPCKEDHRAPIRIARWHIGAKNVFARGFNFEA